MPPHSRPQRKRQAPRQQPRPAGTQPALNPSSLEPGDISLAALAQGAAEPGYRASATPAISDSLSPANRGARRPQRRSPQLEPVDYTPDYDAARRDLRWIAIWSVLLFVAMVALKFSGIV
jgi:hypothetical protein